MAKLRFQLKQATDTLVYINYVISHASKEKLKYTGYSFPSNKINGEYKYWSKKDSRVKGIQKADEINKRLNDIKNIFDAYVSDCNINNKEFVISDIVDKISNNHMTKLKSGVTFLELLDKYIQSAKLNLKPGTWKGFLVLKNDFIAFEKETKATVMVNDMDVIFYKRFQQYLINEKKNTNSTINRKLIKITTVFNFADSELDMNVKKVKKLPKLKQVPAAKFPLLPEEINTIKNLTSDDHYTQLVIDAFNFSLETGLRYSDIVELRAQHFETQIADNKLLRLINLTAVKTDKRQMIPLSDFATQIAEKYIAHIDAGTYPTHNYSKKVTHLPGTLFRLNYAQSVGRELKVIFKNANLNRLCEIVSIQGATTHKEVKPLHEVISFHMARNSYITRLLASGLPSTFVRDNVGHATLRTTEAYYRDSDTKRIAETLAILNKKTQ